MPFSGKDPEKIELIDLLSLVENKVQESKYLDYKLMYGWGEKEKRELLADVSALANTAGGYLIIGVREEDGLPKEIPGIKLSNQDAEKLKIINLLRDGVEPRLPAVSIKMVAVTEENFAIVIAVLKSWIGPHVVTFDKHWRVYGRTSGGKYPLDVTEMRQAFLMSESLAEKIRIYHAHRVGLVASKESACQLDGPKILINVIPFTAFSAGPLVDLGAMKRENRYLPILGANFAGVPRYNIDGILSVINFGSGPEGYCQLFRNGVIESAHVDNIYGQNAIAGVYHEQQIIQFTEDILDLYRLLEVPPPFVIFLSMVDVKNYYFRYDHGIPAFAANIDRDIVNLPEIILNDYDVDIATVIKPAYDAMWNSAGWERSPNYDAQGNRIQRR